MSGDTRFETPFGSFSLRRFPRRPRELQRAWTAADRLLLEAASAYSLPSHEILVVNDEHGALCVALQPRALWTDSALSARALRDNEALNRRQGTPVAWCTEAPPASSGLVVMRVPPRRDYLEYQLGLLARVLAPGTPLLAAGMDKHLSPHTAESLERLYGPTQRHRGVNRARLFSAVLQGEAGDPVGGMLASYHCAEAGGTLCSLPNVFSGDRLDPGTRLMLDHLPGLPSASRVIDLACGNGVLGLVFHRQHPGSRVTFCDESALAIASARRNAAHLFPERQDHFRFALGDGLDACDEEAPDLVLCNPPFHRAGAVDEFVGRRLLRHCARRLVPGGALCVVANRHLSYRRALARDFSGVEQIAQNAKFRLLLARRD